MKKRTGFLTAIVSVCMLLLGAQSALACTPEPDERGVYRPVIYINGEKQELVGAIPPSGSTLVPFREFFDALNLNAEFDNETKTLTAQNDNITLTLTAGKKFATVNGESITLNQTPSLSEDRFYVNLRFIAETFGGEVQFEKCDLRIDINFPDEG